MKIKAWGHVKLIKLYPYLHLRINGCLPWFMSLLISKHLVFVKDVLELCFKKCAMVNQTGLALTWPQESFGVDETWQCAKVSFCFTTMLKSPPRQETCALLGMIHAVCREVWKTVCAPAATENLPPFPRALMMSLPPNPFTPPPGEKVYLENEFSLLHFLINEWNVCFAILNSMFAWLVLATPGQAPIEEVTDLLGICNKIRSR